MRTSSLQHSLLSASKACPGFEPGTSRENMQIRPTRMGFEPTRAEHNGLAVHRLNHSATSSLHGQFPMTSVAAAKSKLSWIFGNCSTFPS